MRIGATAVVCILRKTFAQAEYVLHKPPSPYIIHVGEMAQESVEGYVAERLHGLQFSPPTKQMDRVSSGIERFCCIVERRCPSPKYTDGLPGQRREVDVVGGMGT